MKTKAKLIFIAIMIVIIVVTTTEKKSGIRTKIVSIWDCVTVEDFYEVIVEDDKGNLWSYYDDKYYPKGTKMIARFDTENKIIDAEVLR